MTKRDDAVSPCIESVNHAGVIQLTTSEAGLTKREYLAAMAMQSFLNRTDAERTLSEGNDFMINQISAASVKAADYLINALNKPI